MFGNLHRFKVTVVSDKMLSKTSLRLLRQAVQVQVLESVNYRNTSSQGY